MDSASANKIGIKLLRDENGKLAYTWRLLPEVVWRQRNWWDGAMQFYHSAETPNMYGLANGVWAATENEISLGPRIWSLSYGVPNGGMENNSTSGFTATGLTAAVTTTASAVAGGLYALSLTGCDTSDDLQTSSLPNPTRYASRSIRAVCWARIPSGSASVTLHIDQNTGAGFVTAANSGSVALSTTYQQLRTGALSVNAGVTALRLRLVIDSGANATVQVDEFSIEDTPTASNMMFPPFHMMTISSTETLVHVTQTAVWTWNELVGGSEGTTGYWALQYWAPQAITGARVWDNRLFLAHGEAADYAYSSAADPSTYTTSITLTEDKAQRFVMGRTLGDNTWAMFKTNTPDELWSTTNPQEGGTAWGGSSASAAFEVGFSDRDVTGVYEGFGTVLVGKEDGLYVVGTQDFSTNFLGMTNVAEGLQFSVGMTHFDRGTFYAGNFYTLINDGRLWRWNGSQWQDLASITDAPGFSELGGRVTSLGSDGQWLYFTIEDRATASTTKETWLFMARESSQGWEIHSIGKVRMTNAYGWGALVNSTSRFIYVAGDHSNCYASYRIQMGTRSNTPRLATLNALMLSGTITMPFVELPQLMAANRLELLSEDLNANVTVSVSYGVDNDTAFNNMNATDWTFNTSPIEVLAFAGGVDGKRIRLRFTLDTNSLTATPVIKGFNLYFTRLREWQIVAEIAENQSALQGVPNALPAEQMLARLATLRNSVEGAPLQFDDLDGVARRCTITEMEEVNVVHRTGSGGTPIIVRGVRITLREAVV